MLNDEHSNTDLLYFSLDVDECSDHGTNKCGWHARCINTQGSYTCSCSSGFHGDGMSCRDFDECAEDVHDCHLNANCENTWGSYRCTCVKGYHGNGKQCKGEQVMQIRKTFLIYKVQLQAVLDTVHVTFFDQSYVTSVEAMPDNFLRRSHLLRAISAKF